MTASSIASRLAISKVDLFRRCTISKLGIADLFYIRSRGKQRQFADLVAALHAPRTSSRAGAVAYATTAENLPFAGERQLVAASP